MRKRLLPLFILLANCQTKTFQSSAPSGPATAAKFAGRVFTADDCHVHIELLTVDVVGPGLSTRRVCEAPVTPTGRYQASCPLKRAEYSVELRSTRDGRVLRSRAIDLRSPHNPAVLTEIDFEACDSRTVELATPRASLDASSRDDSTLE